MAGWTMAVAAVCSAALFVVTDNACARSNGLSGGHSIGIPFGRNFGARASVDRGALPYSRWAHNRFCTSGCRASRLHRIRNLGARTGNTLLLGGYGAAGNTAPYEGDDTGENFSPVLPVSPDFAPTTFRPTCHWETQTRIVPSEAGGVRKIAIVRCVSAAGGPSGALDRRSITEDPSAADSATHRGADAHPDDANTDTLREPRVVTDDYRIETRRLPQESNSEAAAPQ